MNAIRLFLSYHSADRTSVVAVRKLLAGRGIATFLDRDSLVVGLPWPQALEEGLRSVSCVAVFLGSDLGGWQKREMYFALDRQVREEKQGQAFPVIPVLLPGADLTPGFLFTNTWIDLRTGLEGGVVSEALDAFERAIGNTQPAQVPERGAGICPYRGLEVFREEDAAFFFGRKAFAGKLLDFTLGKDLVAVVGPSGSGKSSLVQAGLLPLLRREQSPTWDTITFTPGNDPFHRLASALIPPLEPDKDEVTRLAEAETLGADLATGKTRIESVLNRIIEKSNGTGRVLVIADQFEELFTVTAEPNRRPFAQALLRAVGGAPLTLLITLRADFYSQIITIDRELSDQLLSGQVNIGALTPGELRECITEPARLVGLQFERGLVERILSDVGGEPGRLPLLEFALAEVWRGREGKQLTNRAYDDAGGATGALAQRAECEFARLKPEEQMAARRLFSRLVRVARPDEAGEDTRQRAELSETDMLAKSVANRLADSRLLVTGDETRTGALTVEVGHEALIRNWARLRVWLNEDREFLLWRQRLQVQVEEWQKERSDAGYLLRGAPLSEAERWLLGRRRDLKDPEQQLIRESIALRDQEHAEEERRRQAEVENARRLRDAAESRAAAEQQLAEKARALAGEQTKSARAERQRVSVLRRSLWALGALFLVAAAAALVAWKTQLTARSREFAARAETLVSLGMPGDALDTAIRAFSIEKTSEAREAIVRTFPQNLTKLEGHSGSVSSAAFSPDGQRVVTASDDKTARVWNAATGQVIAKLEGHSGSVRSTAFSSDGQRVVTASDDKTARVWNAATGQLIAKLEGDSGSVRSAAFSPDGQRVVTASDDKTAGVWNAATGQLIAKLEGHSGSVSSAAFSPDGQRVVTASDDKTARVWNAATGQLIAKLEGHSGSVWSAAFSPDGQRVVTASDDKTARVWNAATSQLIAKLEGHSGSVRSAAFSPDGQRVVTASVDKTARVWNAATGQLIAKLEGHFGSVWSAAFSPDGQRVVTASVDNTARVWNAATGQVVAKPEGHSGPAWSAAFSPDGQRVVTASYDKTARVWNTATGQVVAKLEGHSDRVWSAAFSPDGQRVLTASDDNTARVWNAATGRLIAKLEGHSEFVQSAAFSPDGQRVVTASGDKTARVWNAATGQLIAKLEGHSGSVQSAAFSPDGQRVVTASDDKTARVWNAATGQVIAKLEGHSEFVQSAAFSPDGQRVVTASWDKTARVWNAATGQLIAKLEGHSGSVQSAAFSPDGQRVVTASDDKTARVWNAATGQLIAKLEGHSGSVRSAAFSPDGQRLVTASDDNTARVWNAASGQVVAKLEGHSYNVRSAAFSPDGQRVVTASYDKTARVWNAATGQVIAKLEGHSEFVQSAAFSPDGQRVVTASDDKTARIFKIVTSEDIMRLLSSK